jgi:phosphoribosylaminoimidazolecarboxamide formyltransferase/IMP cyclohydrolase
MDKTAYLSVYDKTGVEEFARGLAELDFLIYASGSTYKLLAEAGIEAEEVRYSPPVPSAVLKALSGRFPAVSENGVELPAFYVVAANLYPIASIVGQEEFAIEELTNYLDQANSAVLRAAARDFTSVITVSTPVDYGPVLRALKEAGGLEPAVKKQLAARAWQYLAAYDATVAQYLSETGNLLGDEVVMSLKKVADLEYGENRHQRAAFYALSGARPRGLNAASILSGPALNFNHYLDLDTAFELALEFEEPVCVIAKHDRPAGVCAAGTQAESLRGALRCDPAGAVGGTAAFNRQVEGETAAVLADTFIESVVAPAFSPEALKILKGKAGLRAVALPPPVLSPYEVNLRSVSGGLLIEAKDNRLFSAEPACVTRRKPSEAEMLSLSLAWKTVKYAKTYAVALAEGRAVAAVSAAESSTYDAVRGAAWKMRDKRSILPGAGPLVLAADAALPLKTLQAALAAGVTAVIQPGGWQDDDDCVRLCDEKGAAMLFAGIRHFRH